jgi:uncharacterized repeat protein (TIGR01451 family)
MDVIPSGLTVTVNGVPRPGLDPETGIPVGSINANDETVITFKADVMFVPDMNPIPNICDVSYEYSSIAGGIPSEYNQSSNTVFVTVSDSPHNFADVYVSKTASHRRIKPGEMLSFDIITGNLGPATAENVTLSDYIPQAIESPEYSLDGIVFFPWQGSITLGDIKKDDTVTVTIRGTVSENAHTSTIINIAIVSSLTPDPDLTNNTSTAVVQIERETTPRCQAVTDVIQSAALQEAAIAHILNAEGEKLQEIAAMVQTGKATPSQALAINDTAADLIEAVNMLESAIRSKVKVVLNSNPLCRGNAT